MSRFTANKLKEVRAERGYSQSEAAKYMHISDRTLSAIAAQRKCNAKKYVANVLESDIIKIGW